MVTGKLLSWVTKGFSEVNLKDSYREQDKSHYSDILLHCGIRRGETDRQPSVIYHIYQL